MNHPGIYTITHIASGRVYFGRAENIRTRLTNHRTALRHRRHPNRYLQRAWDKYGESAFVFAVWANLSDVPRAELSDRLHQAESAADATFPKRYNLDIVKPTGIERAAETRARMSTVRRTRWANDPNYAKTVIASVQVAAARPECRALKSKSMSEFKSRPEERDKSAARTKILWIKPGYADRVTASGRATRATPEYFAAHSERMKEISNRPKVKDACRARKRADWNKPEYREARLADHAARLQDPAYLAKLSVGVAASWAKPEIHAKKVAALRAASAKPKVKANRSAGQKKRFSDQKQHAKQKALLHKLATDPEVLAKRGKKTAELWADPKHRAKRVAALRAGWAKKRAAKAAAKSPSVGDDGSTGLR